MTDDEIGRIARSVAGDHALRRVAELQNRVVSRRQMRLFLSTKQIRGRSERGVLHPLLRGVFLFGGLPAPFLSLATAAILVAPRGILSHFTAAHLRGFWREPLVVDITLPASRTDRRGLRFHEGDPECRILEALPVTTAARAVVDVASLIEVHRIPKLVGDAMREARVTRDELLEAARRSVRGVEHIRRVLYLPDDIDRARSEAERKLRRIIIAAGLPVPQQNVAVAGHVFDLVWPRHRLIVEYDSWLFHHTPDRAAADRRRTNAAQLAGWTVLRFTDGDLLDPADVLAAIRLATLPTPAAGSGSARHPRARPAG